MSTSLFFIRNPQHNTKTLEVYLNRRDYTVETESLIPEAIEKVKNTLPAYVFVAWDHIDKSIKSIASQLPENVVIIPYITSVANSDTRKLMMLDVPLKLFPPLTGPAIQRLISKYEKDKVQLSDSQNRNLNASKNDRDEVYVNKGSRFRDMNTVMTDRLVGEKLEANLDPIFFDSITDTSLEKPTAQFSQRMHVKISPAQKQALENKFETKIQEELKEIIETAKESTTSESKQITYCVLVQSIDCSGLVLLSSEWNISLEEAQSSLAAWADELTLQFYKDDGRKEIYQSDVFSISTPQELNVFKICNSKATLSKEIVIDGKTTGMSFFDLQNNPFTLRPAEDKNYLMINHRCLKANSIINFDLFFELKENKKMLKMFKKNSTLTQKEINTVLEKKILPLMININDEILWYQYGVEVYLKQD